MVGMTYRKIGFTCSPMYVNSEAGFLVAPEPIAEKYTDGRLSKPSRTFGEVPHPVHEKSPRLHLDPMTDR